MHEIYSGNEKEASGTVPYGKGQNRRNRKNFKAKNREIKIEGKDSTID